MYSHSCYIASLEGSGKRRETEREREKEGETETKGERQRWDFGFYPCLLRLYPLSLLREALGLPAELWKRVSGAKASRSLGWGFGRDSDGELVKVGLKREAAEEGGVGGIRAEEGAVGKRFN